MVGKYDGVEFKIIDGIIASPFIGISLHNRSNCKFKISTEYLTTNIYAQSKFFYSLSLSLLVNFRKNESLINHKYIINY